MELRTLSIQVGQPREVPTAEGPYRTGMVKARVEGPIELATRSLADDGWENLQYHGHEDQAVCCFVAQHFQDLATELGLPAFAHGSFGDNFTVEGGNEENLRIGAVYRVGTALVEITKPRSPCSTLNRVWGSSQLAAAIGRSARTGWYLRVLEPGLVQAGDVWQLERPAVEGALTVAECWRAKSAS